MFNSSDSSLEEQDGRHQLISIQNFNKKDWKAASLLLLSSLIRPWFFNDILTCHFCQLALLNATRKLQSSIPIFLLPFFLNQIQLQVVAIGTFLWTQKEPTSLSQIKKKNQKNDDTQLTIQEDKIIGKERKRILTSTCIISDVLSNLIREQLQNSKNVPRVPYILWMGSHCMQLFEPAQDK